MATPSVAAAHRGVPAIAAEFRNGVDALHWRSCNWPYAPRDSVFRDFAPVDATLRGLEHLVVELRQTMQAAGVTK